MSNNEIDIEAEKSRMITELFEESMPDQNDRCTCGIIAVGDSAQYEDDAVSTLNAKKVISTMKKMGIEPIVLKSLADERFNCEGGWSGYHIFVRFEKPIPMTNVRKLLQGIIRASKLSKLPKILP